MLDPDPEAEQPYRRSRWRGPCFRDRADAGRRLAAAVARERARPDLVVALSRSSVPVARPVADDLGVPLEVVTVRAISPPGDATMPIAAVTEEGSTWIDEARAPRFTGAAAYLRREITRARRLAQGTVRDQRDRDPVDPARLSVLVVAEVIDYPAPVAAVVRQLRGAGAREVAVAAPVVASDCCEEVRTLADDLLALKEPAQFVALAQFYGSRDGGPGTVAAPASPERARPQ